MKRKTLEKAKLNIATTLLNQLVTTVCGIIIPHLLLVSFGSEAYGITVSITQFLSYITLLESGIAGVARGKLYGPLARGDSHEVSAVYRAVQRFFQAVALAFFLYSLLLGFTFYDVAHVSLFSRSYIFFLVLAIGLSTLMKYMGGIANLTLIVADQKQYVNNLVMIVTTLVKTLTCMVLLNCEVDLIWVKLGSSLIFAARPLFYTLYVKRHYELPKVKKGEAVLEQKWTGIGQHMAYFIHINIDIALLTVLADAQTVAVYSVYSLVITSVRAIAESFSGGMEAAFGEMIAKNELERLRRSYRRYKALLTAAAVVLFCCTGILIVPFVQIYTKGITDANYTQPLFALILVLAEAVNCMMLPCSSLPVAANRLKETRWGAYGEAAINVAVSFLLIWWEPLLGVALGTLAATVFRGMFYMRYAARHLLRLPVRRLYLRFAGTFALLCGGILAGRAALSGVAMENYLQWAAWGAVTFAAVGTPAALWLKRRRSFEKREMDDEKAADREQ